MLVYSSKSIRAHHNLFLENEFAHLFGEEHRHLVGALVVFTGLSKYRKDTQTTQRHTKTRKDGQRHAKTGKDARLCVSLHVFARLCVSLRSLGVFVVFR